MTQKEPVFPVHRLWALSAALFFMAVVGVHEAVGQDLGKPDNWIVDPGAYEWNASAVTVPVKSGAPVHEDDMLAAFAGNEVRGVARPSPAGEDMLFFITLFGNTVGEALEFRWYSANAATVFRTLETLEFIPNQITGTTDDPLLLMVETPRDWDVDPSGFDYFMSVVASVELDGVPVKDPVSRVGVFHRDRARGVASAIETPDGPRFFLTVYGNTAGDVLSIYIDDPSTGGVTRIAEPLLFYAQAVVGTIADPVVFTGSPGGGNVPPIIADPSNWSVDPGQYQFTSNLMVDLYLNGLPSTRSDDRIGLFAGVEPRAIAEPTSIDGAQLFFITVYGNVDGVSLDAYALDSESGTVGVISEQVVFQANNLLGSVSNPLRWNAAINRPNRAPTASDDSISIDEDISHTFDPTVNDNDPEGGILTVVAVGTPASGTASFSGNLLTYVPESDWHGTDTFTYDVADAGGIEATGSVTVTVAPVIDDPVAVDDTVTTDEDTSVVVFVLANDSDPDDDALTVVVLTEPSHGTLNLATDSSFTFTPAENYYGEDSFTYQASDGTVASTAATVSITILPINDAPVATRAVLDVNDDIPGVVTLVATDVDGDDLTYSLAMEPTLGTASLEGAVLSYTPSPGVSGTDTFTYTASDAELTSEAATITVTIAPVADSPEADADAYTTAEDTALEADTATGVLANDSDPDDDALTAVVVTAPSHGTLSLATDGSFTYTPAEDYVGEDSFTYRATDGELSSSDTAVTITITPLNDVPVAQGVSFSVDEDTAGTETLSGNDIDGDDLAYALATDPTLGTAAIDGAELTYTPTPGANGTDTFTYTATDGTLTSAPATITVTIGAVNDAPVTADDSYATDEDAVLTVDAETGVLANDTDVDGDALTVAVALEPTNGTLILNANGSFTYTPEANYHGADSFKYTASDGALSSPATVTMTVNPVNDAPVASDATLDTDEDIPGAVTLEATDLEGDALIYALATDPTLGTAAIDGAELTYTPTPGANGTDTFTYTATDGTLTSAPATITVTIGAVNDAPVTADDSYATDEDAVLTVDAETGVLANDTDVDGDALTVAVALEPTNGTLILNANGSFTYTPEANYHGADSFKYTASDGALSSPATVTMTVNPVNDAPVASDATLDTDEDIPGAVTLEATDLEGDALIYALATDPTLGTAAIDGAELTYTPTPGANGTDTFTYTATDGTLTSAPATITVTIGAVNDAPVTADDSYATDEDAVLTVDAETGVLANDTDVDGDALTVAVALEPTNGTLILNANGSFTYTPEANYHGADSFKYTASDGALSSPATVTMTVNPVNDAPVASDATLDTDEDIPGAVTLEATDLEGDALIYALATDPTLGTAAIDGAELTYTPTPGANGTDTFTYTATDGTLTSAPATITVTIGAVNDAPVTADDSYATDEDAVLTVDAETGVLANDTDVDGDALTVAVALEPTNGTLILNANGSFTYTPEANYHGADSFKYTASDGALSSPATVTMTVNPVNDAPVASDATLDTDEDIPGAVTLEATDLEGDALIYALATDPTLGTAAIDGAELTYTPTPGASGTDTFTYTATDGTLTSAPATITVTIGAVNDAPVTADDSYATDEDAVLTVDAETGVLANDTDVDGDALTVAVALEPTNGTLILNANGSFTYTPEANYHGADSFKYTASDGALSSPATVTMTVNPVNDAPVASDATLDTDEDIPGAVTLEATDLEGDALIYALATDPTLGTAAIDGAELTYTPTPGASGTDTFTYTATDGTLTSAPATITVTIGAVNDAPVTADDSYATDEDAVLTVDAETGVLANDTDVDGDALTVAVALEPTNGTLILNANGSFTNTPEANYHGADSFKYTASDGALSSPATVTMTVNPVNDAPVASDATLDTDEDIPGAVTLEATDLEGDALIYALATDPTLGTAAIDGAELTYTPTPGASGTDTFTYTATDGTLTSAPATITVTIGAVNDAPVATADAYATHEDVSLLIVATAGVLSNDTDADGDALSATVGLAPTHGTLVLAEDGSFTYTPEANYHGTDTFKYTATDGTLSAPATVTITVNSVNDVPIALDDHVRTNEGEPITVSPLENDTDIDGDPLTISGFTAPAHGVVTDNADGTLTYVPGLDFAGNDSFTYTVSDRHGGEDEGLITISGLDAVADAVTTDEDTPTTFDPTVNDTDPEGDPLTVTSVSMPSHGSTRHAGNEVTYTPSGDFHGQDIFTYTITDGLGSVATGTVTITVNPVNDPPSATADAYATDEDTPLEIDASAGVLQNDSDKDGDSLSATVALAPTNGTLTLSANGSFTYTPNANYYGTDGFEYAASDGALSGIATVTISVRPVNDPPVAVADDESTDEDTPVTLMLVTNDLEVDGEAISIDSVTDAANGSTRINVDGTVTYDPEPDWSGTDSFSYVLSDESGHTTEAVVTITVFPVNDPPITSDDTRRAFEGSTSVYDPRANDVDIEGDELIILSVSGMAGTAEVNADGLIEYMPAAGSLEDQFVYSVSDGQGGLGSATVDITIVPLPTDDDGIEETVENLAPNDGDGNGDGVADSEQANVASLPSAVPELGFVTLETEAGGELADVRSVAENPAPVAPPAEATFPAGFLNYSLSGGSGDVRRKVTITLPPGTASNAYFKFGPTPEDPSPHWYNFGYDGTTGAVIVDNRITLHFVDGMRGDDDLSANGVIVDPGAPAMIPNQAPDAQPDALVMDEDSPATLDLLLNDSDPDGGRLSIVSTTRPRHGLISRKGSLVTYTPNVDFHGDDGFVYLLSDGQGATVEGSVSVTVRSVNDLPVVEGESVAVDEDSTLTVWVLANDSDVDGDRLVLVDLTTPGHGTASITTDTLIVYTPDPDFAGTDTMTYTVGDGAGGFADGVLAISVLPVADGPLAGDDEAILEPGESQVVISVLHNDIDVDHETLAVSSVEQPVHGSATILTDSTIAYTAGPTFTGSDFFRYTIQDPGGATSTATVRITGINAEPVAVDDEATLAEDNVVRIDVLANDSDANGDSLYVAAVSEPAHGQATLLEDGRIEYAPERDYFGADSLQYTLADGRGATAVGILRLDVVAVNDPPVFSGGPFTAPSDSARFVAGGLPDDVLISVMWQLAHDVDSETLTYSWVLSKHESLADTVWAVDPATSGFSFTVHQVAVLLDSLGVGTGMDASLFHRLSVSDGDSTVESSVFSIILERGYVTGIDAEELPERYELFQNYPNPYNPITTIRFALPADSPVSLVVFDALGRRVSTVVNERMRAGYHEVLFGPSNLASGIYLYVLRSGPYTSTRSMVLLR